MLSSGQAPFDPSEYPAYSARSWPGPPHQVKFTISIRSSSPSNSVRDLAASVHSGRYDSEPVLPERHAEISGADCANLSVHGLYALALAYSLHVLPPSTESNDATDG